MYERFLGLFFIGLVIKMMDDFLDQDIDRLCEVWNITFILGRGILPYTLVLMSVALYYNFDEAIGFFTASYLMGMAYERNNKLPTRILAWQEGLIIFIIGIFMTSVSNSLGCLLLIILLQFIDDLIDYRNDEYLKKENYVSILGKVNVLLAISIIFMLVLLYFPIKLLYFAMAVFLIYLIIYLFKTNLDRPYLI